MRDIHLEKVNVFYYNLSYRSQINEIQSFFFFVELDIRNFTQKEIY